MKIGFLQFTLTEHGQDLFLEKRPKALNRACFSQKVSSIVSASLSQIKHCA